MAPLRVLVTGFPGVGKTTLCSKVAEALPEGAAVGFLCRERRNARGQREAFDLVTLDGSASATLADENGPDQRRKVSKYFVQVDQLESFSFPILDQALNTTRSTPFAFVFDEIGTMELVSDGFVDRVRRLLTSPDPNLHVLGTVAMKGRGFVNAAKQLPGVDVVEVTQPDRDAKAEEVTARFLAALQGGGGADASAGPPKERRWAPKAQASGASAAPAAASTATPPAAGAPSASGAAAGGRVRFDLPPPGAFSAVYIDDPDANFASVNAGSSNLFVGGSSINRAFRDALQDCGQRPKDKYEVLHEALLRKASASPGTLQWISAGQDADAWAFEDADAVCGLVPEGEGMAALRPVGLVSIVVFPEGRRPKRNDRNVAMVYVVGPNCGEARKKGRRDVDKMTKTGFLDVVETIGGAISSAVRQYNEVASAAPAETSPAPAAARRVDPEDGRERTLEECQQHYQGKFKPQQIREYWQHTCRPPPGAPLPKIDILRVCLLSGGVYKHPDASKVEVASSLVRGLTSATLDDLPILDFAFDEDCFRLAWKAVGDAGASGSNM